VWTNFQFFSLLIQKATVEEAGIKTITYTQMYSHTTLQK